MKKIITESVVMTFFLCSCGNIPAPKEVPVKSDASVAHVQGAAVYNQTCVTCHQATGEGIPNTYPPLAKSDFIKDKQKTIEQVIKGYVGELTVNGKKYNSNMPAQSLNDEEIAAVLTFVYNNFGNKGDAVTVADVRAVRVELK